MKRAFLICYDIADNRVRRQNLRRLRAVATGYQDSCFEVLASGYMLPLLLRELVARMDCATDRLLVAPLNSFSCSWQLGVGPITPTGPLLVIN